MTGSCRHHPVGQAHAIGCSQCWREAQAAQQAAAAQPVDEVRRAAKQLCDNTDNLRGEEVVMVRKRDLDALREALGMK